MLHVGIVTGGAGGIGSAICRALAADGNHIVIADYIGEEASRLAAAIRSAGGHALPLQVDVGEKASVNEMVQKTLEHYPQIDFLINGAGVISRMPVQDMAEEEWDRVIRINLKGVFLCSQAAAAHMVKRGEGRIINIASGRGVAGQARAAHYASSKAGVIAFTKSLAMELAPHNVLVNAIAPGATDTPMSRSGSTEEEWERRSSIPPLMGGLTAMEDIVGLVRYLLSENIKHVTGQLFFLKTP